VSAVEVPRRPTAGEREHELAMLAITARNETSVVRHASGESLAMKQSWKDNHWYCDGLTLAPQAGEDMLAVLDRFDVIRGRLEQITGTAGASSADEETPF